MSANTTLTYDLADQPLTTVLPGPGNTTIRFTLDALGQIVTRTPPGGSAEPFSYLGTSETVWAIGGATSVSAALDPGGNRVATSAGGSTGFLLPDLHANLAAVTDAGETAIVAALRYDPYGQTVATSGSVPSPWRFQGRLDLMANPADPLYEWSARTYLPTTGAFSQLDAYPGSVGDPRSLNRYLYAAANPWTLVDPTGHRFCATLECDARNDFTIPATKNTPPVVVTNTSRSQRTPAQSVVRITNTFIADLGEALFSVPQDLCWLSIDPGAWECKLEQLGSLASAVEGFGMSLQNDEVPAHLREFAWDLAHLSDSVSGMNGPLAQEDAIGDVLAAVLLAIGPTKGSLRRVAADAIEPSPFVRLERDILVDPTAPRPLPLARPIGLSSTQNAWLQDRIADLRQAGATDFRVNQQQVNINGTRVGINRPDLQYTLSGVRYYVEVESRSLLDALAHGPRIRANDPHGVFVPLRVP